MNPAARRAASLSAVAISTALAACASAGASAAGALAGGAPDDRTPLAPAGVLLNDRVVTYPVRGRTVGEVWRAMTAAAPTATGTAYHGRNDFALSWQWRTAAGTGLGCELRDPRVSVTSQITVPTLVPDSAAEPRLVERWAAYDAALRRHERGHEVIAARAAGDLVHALRRVRTAGCLAADSEGDRTARAALTALQAAERAYDDSTGHGRTQGAVWPPDAVRFVPVR